MTRLNALVVIVVSVLLVAVGASAQFFARDPGVRPGPAGAGRMLDGLTGLQPDLFTAGLEEFQESDPLEEGLGPRFNLDSCVGCHSQPAIGGTSPRLNPPVGVAPGLRPPHRVRPGPAGAGRMLDGLTGLQPDLFTAGLEEFQESDPLEEGLGPRFNLDSCVGCHSQPAIGGTSPAVNPQVEVATAFGALNVVPSFITLDGPVREARFKHKPNGTRDGGVHALFVVSGRNDGTADASGCPISQDDCEGQLAADNVIFRIPTPTFGAGLIEQIPDSTILANRTANAALKAAFGISGRPNRNGNDGTIARFGWKAQNKSLLLFSGEAYNVEMGITNELFQTERDETTQCQYAKTPNDATNTEAVIMTDTISSTEKFAMFMRFLAPPKPSEDTPGGVQSI